MNTHSYSNKKKLNKKEIRKFIYQTFLYFIMIKMLIILKKSNQIINTFKIHKQNHKQNHNAINPTINELYELYELIRSISI